MHQTTRYNNLAAWYAQDAAVCNVASEAGCKAQADLQALSEAASNVASLYAQGLSYVKERLPILASEASNGRVRSFYQAALSEATK